MVCSVENGKMAAMARILGAVRFSQISTEEVGSQILTAKYMEKDLHEADEANLLDEEDMHIYDLMPLTDPLHLVICNACKKPIKISQYAAHAEICKSLRFGEEMVLELNSGTRHKKRPKKERKKLTAAYGSTPSEEQEGLDSAKVDMKRNSSEAPKMDGSGVCPGIPEYSAEATPPTKRSKLIPAEAIDKSDHQRIVNSVVQSSHVNTQEHTCQEHRKGSTSGCKQCSDCVVYHKSDEIHDFSLQLQSKDIPAPLGTKMYYSLRNYRLRSAVKCMYYESFSEHSVDGHLNESQGDEMELQVSIPTNSHVELKVQIEKGKKQPLPFATSLRKTEQVLGDCSDVYMSKLGHIPAKDFSNQDPVNSSLNSQAKSMGNVRSKYLPQSFSFSGSSGSSLETMQQSKGSVHVT